MLFSAALTILASLASGAAIAPAYQSSTDYRAVVQSQVQSAENLGLDEIWAAAATLVASAGDDTASLAAAFDAGLQSAPSERATLLLAAARVLCADPDRTAIAERLAPLVESTDELVAQGAAALLTEAEFKGASEEAKQGVCKRLTAVAQNGDRAPETRLECAVALHVLGNGQDHRTARKEMMAFLASSEVRLRNLGALSLARIGDVETGQVELRRMASLPGDDGRLAEAFLTQEDIRRVYDRKQKNLVQYNRDSIEKVDLSGKADLKLIEKVIRLIQTAALEGDKVKREDLIDAALDGMLRSIDEHSSFMTSKVFKDFAQDLLQPQYGGIGAYVGEDPEDKLFTIRQPIYSGPAYRAGLHSEDKIVRIGEWPTLGRPVDDIIKRLKGEPGTSVKLYVWRRGMDAALIDRPTEEMAVTITREEITIPPVKAELLPGKIGLVELTTFSRVASEELAAKILDLQQKGMRGLVLDLRNNTGGLLTEAANVCSLFLPKKKLVVTTESRTEDPEKLHTRQDPIVPADIPIAVVINRFSASASEIVAGALQDHQRAEIVGQASFGKGSVQQLLNIPNEQDDQYEDKNQNERYDPGEPLTKDVNGNGEFDFAPRARLTIARYLLPSGRSIHREIGEDGTIVSEGGVQPDTEADHVSPRRFEPWKLEEIARIRRERKARAYLDEHYAKNRELFHRLADGDRDDTSQYPKFDEYYNSLQTTLSPQEVRFLLRTEVRGRVQDDRGAAFPDGDYEEDPQLQQGIRVVLDKLGVSLAAIEEFAATFEPADKRNPNPGRVLSAHLSDRERSDLRHALSLIVEAKNGTATPEQLAEIEKALQSVLDK